MLFFAGMMGGKLSDKFEAIRIADPKRASRIAGMLILTWAGLTQISHTFDRRVQADLAQTDSKVKLIRSVQPVYPPLAKQNQVQGTVRLDVTVSPEGRVRELRLLDGNPMLVDAAMQAAGQWFYRPARSCRRPVSAKTEIDIDFRLDTGTAR